MTPQMIARLEAAAANSKMQVAPLALPIEIEETVAVEPISLADDFEMDNIDDVATGCAAVDWMIRRASLHLTEEGGEVVTWCFAGRVPSRMLDKAREWAKQRAASEWDGRRTGCAVPLLEVVDEGKGWYRYIGLKIEWGSFKGTANDVTLMVTKCDGPLL